MLILAKAVVNCSFCIIQMREPGCPYLTDKGQLRVQVEWGECYLLFQATYHKYDDVCRIHNYQMRSVSLCMLMLGTWYGLIMLHAAFARI